jgi:hypothetical protein
LIFEKIDIYSEIIVKEIELKEKTENLLMKIV